MATTGAIRRRRLPYAACVIMAGIGKVIEISAGDSCCSFPHIEKSRFLQSATLTRGMHANKVKFAQTGKSVGAKKPRRQQRRGNHRLPVLAGLNPWLKINLNGERFTNEASIPINDGSKLVSRRDSRRDKQKPTSAHKNPYHGSARSPKQTSSRRPSSPCACHLQDYREAYQAEAIAKP